VAVKRLVLLAGFLTAVVVAVSCSESLDGGKACPALCPEQSLPIHEVTLDAVTLDTTVGPFPIRGTEPGLLLASRGDTLDVRAVVRFDSLPSTYTKNGTSHDVTLVDSSRLFIRIDTSAVNFKDSVTLELYDVDTTAVDSSSAAVIALFRPDRLLGSRVIQRSKLFIDDTVTVSIPNDFIGAKVRGHGRVRIGFRMVGAGDLTLQSIETSLPVALQFDPAPGDTTVASRSMGPLSNTPVGDPLAANDLRDFSLVVKGAPRPAERVSAGGLPAYRAYLKLAIPKFYLDSVVIVRAQLVLTPKPILGDTDLVTVYPVIPSTSATVTDLSRAAQLVYPAFSFAVQAIARTPKDTAQVKIDMVQLFRQWAASSLAKNPPQTAIVLRGANEGRASGRLAFYGLDGPAEFRPRLRLSYVARSRFGIP
jgi:hypothetical protein